MLLSEIKKILEAELIGDVEDLEKEIKIAYGSDLMSDVLAFVKQDALLLTGLTNSQVIRTAEMAGIVAICFVRGKKPREDTIKLAKENEIPILVTRHYMYESCGYLHRKGLPGCEDLK